MISKRRKKQTQLDILLKAQRAAQLRNTPFDTPMKARDIIDLMKSGNPNDYAYVVKRLNDDEKRKMHARDIELAFKVVKRALKLLD